MFVIEKNTVRNRYDTPGNKQTAFVAPRRFPIEVQKIEHGRCLPLQQHKGQVLGVSSRVFLYVMTQPLRWLSYGVMDTRKQELTSS